MPWARAFGLDVEADFDAPGLPRTDGPGGARRVALTLAAPGELEADWAPGEATRLGEERFGAAQPERTVDRHPRLGYRLYAKHYGVARISSDGTAVRCSEPGLEPWMWQRFLVGRILPFAAVLQGLEALHASAVTVDGHAVALIGASGAGKSSLAAALSQRGCPWLTDDVLALESVPDGVVAHPGAAVLALRPEVEGLLSLPRRALGPDLGRADKLFVGVTPDDRPRPLALAYFLAPGPAGPAVGPVDELSPRLLAATFVPELKTPTRLVAQLDLVARVARGVPAFRLAVRPADGPGALAERVLEHARDAGGITPR